MEVVLPSLSIVDLIERHGSPHYIKLDVKHCDAPLLADLFNADVRPPYLSAECHSVEVFTLMHAQGGYRAYKLVDGRSVCSTYANQAIKDEISCLSVAYSFPFRSAGPFGAEINGKWLSAESMIGRLASVGFGWKDLHATSEFMAESTNDYELSESLNHVRLADLCGYLIRRISSRLQIGGHHSSR